MVWGFLCLLGLLNSVIVVGGVVLTPLPLLPSDQHRRGRRNEDSIQSRRDSKHHVHQPGSPVSCDRCWLWLHTVPPNCFYPRRRLLLHISWAVISSFGCCLLVSVRSDSNCFASRRLLKYFWPTDSLVTPCLLQHCKKCLLCPPLPLPSSPPKFLLKRDMGCHGCINALPPFDSRLAFCAI